MKNSILVLVTIFVSYFTQIKAQAVLYICSETGAYGYCYGTGELENCAYKKCLEAGGKHPGLSMQIYNKGYGAIAIGKTRNGAMAIGASGGCATQEEADRKATDSCWGYGGQDIRIDERFWDR